VDVKTTVESMSTGLVQTAREKLDQLMEEKLVSFENDVASRETPVSLQTWLGRKQAGECPSLCWSPMSPA